MNKLAIIGNLDKKNNSTIGAAVKARSLYEYLSSRYGSNNVKAVDIFGWKSRKVQVFCGIISAFMHCQNVVLVISDTSATLMKVLSSLKRLFKRKVWYVAVGGDIGDNLAQNPERIDGLRYVDAFFLETQDAVDAMKNDGFGNVYILKNFKNIKPVAELKLVPHPPYRFLTFSRVNELKGISDAINAIEKVNHRQGENICTLDIYGEAEDDYKDQLYKLLKKSPNCKYRGVADPGESVEILSRYYCLLFPTHYTTEGIPGTIIDAFAAGLPIICSDWPRRKYLIKNGYNGIAYPFNEYDGLVKAIKVLITNEEIYEKLRQGSIEAFEDYRPDIATKTLIDLIEESSK